MPILDSDVHRSHSIDLFDQNACMTCVKVKLRHMDITGIYLFDQMCIWQVLRVG